MSVLSALHARYLNPLDWAEAGLRAGTFETAWSHVHKSLSALGFGNIAGVQALPFRTAASFPTPPHKVGTIVSREWEEFNAKNPEHGLQHPNGRRMATSSKPVFFLPGHEDSFPLSEADAAYVDWGAAEFGVQGSLGLPVRDRQRGVMHAVFLTRALCDGEFGRLHDEFCDAIHQATAYFFEAVAVNDVRASPDFRPLTPRERACLTWCTVGKTTTEIGDTLSISDATVNEHISNAVKKLGASNRTQACARAALLDMINP